MKLRHILNRYSVFISDDAQSWALVMEWPWFCIKSATNSAKRLHSDVPWTFVQVVDNWRKGKSVIFLAADLIAFRKRHGLDGVKFE